MRRVALLAIVVWALAAGCRREAPAETVAAVDAAAPVGEIVVPAAAWAAGDVVTTRSTLVATGSVRLYKDGKWKGSGQVTLTTEVESRREVLGVDGAGQPTRLRLEYPRYVSTMKVVGGETRDLAPRLAGRSFIADLAGGLSVVAGDGAAVPPAELEVLRRDVEGLTMWSPLAGRTLVIGQVVESPGARFVVKSRGEKTAVVGARVVVGDVAVEGEAMLELGSGRVTRFEGDGVVKIADTGDGRMRVVETYGYSR